MGMPLVFPVMVLLSASAWFTFYGAYQKGLDAQQRGDHAQAVQAFRQAIALEPQPGQQVKTYGLNFLPTYYPYLHMAQACLALGDRAGAEKALASADSFNVEPAVDRERLRRALMSHSPVEAPAQQPAAVETPTKVLSPMAPPGPTPDPVATPLASVRTSPAPALSRVVPAADNAPSPVRSEPRNPAPVEVPPAAPIVAPALPVRHGWGWPLAGFTLLAGLGTAWRLRHRVQAEPQVGSDPNLQRQFGPFRPLLRLGQGGCACAYLGVHRSSGLEVAIKVPHHHLVQDPQFRARFQREAALGAALDHPGICKVLASSADPEDPWLAMDYCRGVTLEAHLRQHGPLPLDQALRLAAEIAAAMAYAHANSVVHRDLKPANIMLEEAGVRVMDFGIARVLDTTRTTSTMFIGTPAYAAPESLQNPQVGPPADRYALGLILFEMLAGRQAFQGHSPFQVLEAHRTQPLPSLAALRPGLSVPLLNLVERLCHKLPAERPEDGETLRCLTEIQVSPSEQPPA
jgi:hypothetical protein